MFLINCLLCVAYYLNPKYQYNHDIALNEELLMALKDVIYRLEGDSDLAAEAISEVLYYPLK